MAKRLSCDTCKRLHSCSLSFNLCELFALFHSRSIFISTFFLILPTKIVCLFAGFLFSRVFHFSRMTLTRTKLCWYCFTWEMLDSLCFFLLSLWCESFIKPYGGKTNCITNSRASTLCKFVAGLFMAPRMFMIAWASLDIHWFLTTYVELFTELSCLLFHYTVEMFPLWLSLMSLTPTEMARDAPNVYCLRYLPQHEPHMDMTSRFGVALSAHGRWSDGD